MHSEGAILEAKEIIKFSLLEGITGHFSLSGTVIMFHLDSLDNFTLS